MAYIFIMKKILLPSLLITLLVGCSSGPSNSKLEQFTEYTGGQTMGDTTSLYWYTEKLVSPYTAADYVAAGDYGWYQTDYRWADGELRELIREGEQIKDNQKLVPYRIHVRFSKEGDAVYQQYRLDGKVLPLTQNKLSWLQQEAADITRFTKEQDDQDLRLVQGYWDGSEFETCAGRTFDKVEFNQTLPSFVVNRLALVDSYVAFLGAEYSDKVVVEELLMLAEDDHDCIERPSLIEE